MQKKSIVFIINPISGTSSKNAVPELIEKHLDLEKYDYSIVFTEYAGHASEIAKKCSDDGVDVVCAVGGDGTINEVAKSVVQTNTALAIIPFGSGNGLARHLMIPINVKGALEVINHYEVHDLDYGMINEYPFFCTCGMGFDAFISMKFAQSGKRGPITYVENVLKEGLKYKPETYEITLNDDKEQQITYKAFLVSCANASQYGNDAYIAPQASMSDGYLDVVIMEPFDILEASQISIDMFNKTLDKNSKIKTFKAKHVHIHRKTAGAIHFDGDPVETTADIDISLVPKGIRILVNPNADKRKRHPNVIQTALTDFFNDIHSVRIGMTNTVKDEVVIPAKQVKALNKYIQQKLTKA